MPASESVVFDAFHYHHWRMHWDSLVRATQVQGGAPCPFKGAITHSAGAGALRGLSMRTEFVAYDRPRLGSGIYVGAIVSVYPLGRVHAPPGLGPQSIGAGVHLHL